MFVVISRLRIPADKLDQARAAIFEQLAAARQQTPGFIEFSSAPGTSGLIEGPPERLAFGEAAFHASRLE